MILNLYIKQSIVVESFKIKVGMLAHCLVGTYRHIFLYSKYNRSITILIIKRNVSGQF